MHPAMPEYHWRIVGLDRRMSTNILLKLTVFSQEKHDDNV